MKKWLVITAIMSILISCGKSKDIEVKEDIVRPAKYMIIRKDSGEVDRVFSATIKAAQESKLGFRVAGTIEEKFVSLGQTVKKGQELAKLDMKDYQVKYEASKANLENAQAGYYQAEARIAEAKSGIANANAEIKNIEANLDKAIADFERYERLFLNDNVSKEEYDRAKAQKVSMEASLEQGKAKLEAAKTKLTEAEANKKASEANIKAIEKDVEYNKLQLSYTTLIAPADGYIVSEDSEVNEIVNGGTPVYTLSLDKGLNAELFVPESLIGQLKIGDSVDVEVKAISNTIFKGSVVEIGLTSTGFGNTYPVKVRIETDDNRVRPGMSADAKFNFRLNVEEDVILVPLNVVNREPSGEYYLFTIENLEDGMGEIKKRVVEVGEVTGKGVEITKGLRSGEHVLTSGINQVYEGLKVKVPAKEEK